jgi:septation ring formation regulator EzrA
MPIERLKFEHQKRQQQISNLEMKYLSLERQFDAIQEQWGEETAHFSTAREWHDYTPPSTSGVESEKAEVGERISSLQNELSALEKAMEAKWK